MMLFGFAISNEDKDREKQGVDILEPRIEVPEVADAINGARNRLCGERINGVAREDNS